MSYYVLIGINAVTGQPENLFGDYDQDLVDYELTATKDSCEAEDFSSLRVHKLADDTQYGIDGLMRRLSI